MSEQITIPEERIEELYKRLDEEAKEGGYHLNADKEFTRGLVRGLLVNEERYGYWACPCRLAADDKEKDLDIICPCDYRDADLLEWGACYCALYVADELLRGQREMQPVPERRPDEESERPQYLPSRAPRPARAAERDEETMPVWRCRVCGYLCARDRPPEICPICKAKQERFERFW